MNFDGIIKIGSIVNSHGRFGEIKVLPLTKDESIFETLNYTILLVDVKQVRFPIIKSRQMRNFRLLKLEGIDDINTAQKTVGQGIYIEEDKIEPLEEDEFFIHDLIHAQVFSTEGEYLGRISHYFQAGPQGICEVVHGKEKFLFPTTYEVLKEIIPSEKVVIELIPGLRELNQQKH